MKYNVKQVIVVRKDLNLRKGKMCSQVAHASMKFLLDRNEYTVNDKAVKTSLTDIESEWIFGPFAKIVVSCDSEQELLDLIQKAKDSDILVKEIIDVGNTEFHGIPTRTCAAFGPAECEVLDKITSHLKLL
jgi:PTH2 family peptidyl-tRNA hydrolase